MDKDRSVSLRASRRPNHTNLDIQDGDDGFFDADKSSLDYPIKTIWKRGFVRLLLVGGIVCMFFFPPFVP
ncbi:hypothetical protein CTI12_AA625600 [Artemisia annua]|uniref:Uncharacterized protein n=1 Tax=Artemisia annua TaxID=35608 RepID=A0A2U1KA80_ARTAN|nr:hypothetical protein CTI12_AA625600 [Artemisia annua]